MTLHGLAAALRRVVVAAVCLLSSAACHHARPLTYRFPPGLSASYNPTHMRPSERYTNKFCTVLAKEFANESWKACSEYVRMAGSYSTVPLDEDFKGWTLLRIGGFGAQCLANKVKAFEDAAEHLLAVHQMPSYHVDVGAFDSSEENAKAIRDFVVGHPDEKFIVIAHSKGAADTLVALAAYPKELDRIKAVITVAGAVGGSWLVDRLRRLNDKLLREVELPSCRFQTSAGGKNAIDSMKRDERQRFLAAHDPSAALAYSISAVSSEGQTSRILQGFWREIAPHSLEQDSHIVEGESIVPWGTFLGRALGDHWAVAMPFHGNAKVRPEALKVINRNQFPRPALIEAAVRIAIADLAKPPR
jgi:pimeloyl-ACP methyl ester carboxylesterase